MSHSRPARLRRPPLATTLLLSLVGCSPADYREDADKESYAILAEMSEDPRWQVPDVSLTPGPSSRLHDPFDPDSPPLPPDDPSAHRLMGGNEEPGCCGWHEDGEASSIEDPGWKALLETSERGTVVLSPDRAVQIGLLHSREYQTEMENLYLSALSLTLERFDFSVQWFLRNATSYQRSREDTEQGESKSLQSDTNAGFSRAFASGGQLIVDLANTFVWEFAGSDSTFVSSRLAGTFVQPLLRGAWSKVRLESLTQAERDTLYAVRDFARFRKQFYFRIVAGDEGFLLLLLELQGIRNLESNLKSLRRNLEEHEALAEAGIVSRIQVDQVFQSYQSGRLSLIDARNSLDSTLDDYKIALGLPPEVLVEIDDALLQPFQLNAPELTALEGEVEALLARFRQLDEPPPAGELRQGYDALGAHLRRVVGIRAQVEEEIGRWKPADEPEGSENGDSREAEARVGLATRLHEMEGDIRTVGESLRDAIASLPGSDPREAWESLQRLARVELALIADLFVIQTQVRAYLIRLEPFELRKDEALRRALANRLDLMNERGQVVDAWRKIRLAANALESDLDVVLAADIGTKPGSDNPFHFSESAARYQAGLRFDGPLDRKAERNAYRATLIAYQRSRRSYMALEDRITQQVRRESRQLEADRLNFTIARQSLIAAARQVEQSRDKLTAPGPAGDSSSTQDVLDALDSLLDAKNALIGTWVAYETNRLQMLLDIEDPGIGPGGNAL